MESGGLDIDIVSKQEPHEFFDKEFYEHIPERRQRKHVVSNVMVYFMNSKNLKLSGWQPISEDFKKMVGTGWDEDSERLKHTGNELLWLISNMTDLFISRYAPKMGLEYFIQAGQLAYSHAFKIESRLKGNNPSVFVFDEMADNYKNLVRAIFESRVRFLHPDKDLSEKVIREMDDVLYYGSLPQLYKILHGRSVEKPPTLH